MSPASFPFHACTSIIPWLLSTIAEIRAKYVHAQPTSSPYSLYAPGRISQAAARQPARPITQVICRPMSEIGLFSIVRCQPALSLSPLSLSLSLAHGDKFRRSALCARPGQAGSANAYHHHHRRVAPVGSLSGRARASTSESAQMRLARNPRHNFPPPPPPPTPTSRRWSMVPPSLHVYCGGAVFAICAHEHRCFLQPHKRASEHRCLPARLPICLPAWLTARLSPGRWAPASSFSGSRRPRPAPRHPPPPSVLEAAAAADLPDILAPARVSAAQEITKP